MSFAATALRPNISPPALASRRSAAASGTAPATSILARAKKPNHRDHAPTGRRAIPVEARLSGFSTGPRVSNSRESTQIIVAKTLLTVREGDLLALTVTPGDGAGHLASGEDELKQIYVTVSKISTSTGGRRQLEGESTGLRVQVIDQGSGLQGARLGVVGLVVEPGAPWIRRLDGWASRLAKLPELERGVMSSVVGIRVLSNLEHLESAVASNPKPWITGADSANRRSIITDPVEAATQTAGELAALLAGSRDVAMAQLWAGWLGADAQPIEHPWAAEMVRRCAESDEIGVEMSESDDVEANPGLTAVFYRKSAEGAAAAAKKVAKLGAQADCSAVTPYERVLVGMALGYNERDIAYHLMAEGAPFSAGLFIRAREVLGKGGAGGGGMMKMPATEPPRKR